MNVDTEIEKTEQCEIGSHLFLYCDDFTREKKRRNVQAIQRYSEWERRGQQGRRAMANLQVCAGVKREE